MVVLASCDDVKSIYRVFAVLNIQASPRFMMSVHFTSRRKNDYLQLKTKHLTAADVESADR
jgi:hypothetical protein